MSQHIVCSELHEYERKYNEGSNEGEFALRATLGKTQEEQTDFFFLFSEKVS